MNYEAHYQLLIRKRQQLILTSEYKELHHIVPRCMGGSDEHHNLVHLTAREHFVAHRLLAKMFPNEPGLIYAAWRMAHDSRDRQVTSRVFEHLKKNAAWGMRDRSFMCSSEYKSKQSEQMKQVWCNNPNRRAAHRDRIKAATMKKVYAEGVVFESLTACAKHFNISVEGVRRRIRTGYKDWSTAA